MWQSNVWFRLWPISFSPLDNIGKKQMYNKFDCKNVGWYFVLMQMNLKYCSQKIKKWDNVTVSTVGLNIVNISSKMSLFNWYNYTKLLLNLYLNIKVEKVITVFVLLVEANVFNYSLKILKNLHCKTKWSCSNWCKWVPTYFDITAIFFSVVIYLGKFYNINCIFKSSFSC